MSASAKNTYQFGSTGIPVPSTISGQNINQSCLQWKNFSPMVLSNTMATQLPNCPCMNVKITNQLGNDLIAVGGLPGSNDDPYFFPNNPGLARGTVVPPGQSHIFKVTNSNLLTVMANRNGDIITPQACLSQSDFMTPTADPPINPVVIPYVPRVFNLGIPEPHLSVSDVLAGHKFHAKSIAQSITVSDAVVKRTIKPRTIADNDSSTVTESVGVVHRSVQLVYNIAQDAVSVGPSACSPVTGAGWCCGKNTLGFYAAGEIATVGNGLTSGPVVKVITTVKSTTGATGTVGCIIVNSGGSIVYTFSSTQSVSSTTGTTVTLIDNTNTYTMAVGDAVLVTWNLTSNMAVSINSGSNFSEFTAYNSSTFTANGVEHGNSSIIDWAAQIFCFF